MSKIPSPLLQMEILAGCLGGGIFPVPEEVVCSFSISFLTCFRLNTNLAYVSKLGEESAFVCNSFYLSKRVSLFFLDQDFFAALWLILSHFELSRIELPKLTLSILMEIVTIVVVLVDQFDFLHAPQAHKALAL